MAMTDEQIEEVMQVLTKWNPLGNMAANVHDLDNYRTEATDILFAIGVSGSTVDLARIVQSVLNQTFDLDLSLDDCLIASAELERIVA